MVKIRKSDDHIQVIESIGFITYEILYSRYTDEQKDGVNNLHDEQVAAPTVDILKKYIEYLAKDLTLTDKKL